jgi:hypothetical protein
VFKEISLDQFKKNLAGMGMPPVLQERMAQAWGVLADFGCTYPWSFSIGERKC